MQAAWENLGPEPARRRQISATPAVCIEYPPLLAYMTSNRIPGANGR